MSEARIEQWLWNLNIAGDIAVVLTLFWRRLASDYRVLWMYFLADLLQSLLLKFLWRFGFSSGEELRAVYLQVYGWGETIKWILSLWFVLELYGRALAPQPAIAKFAKGAVGIVFAVSAAVSLVGLFLGPQGWLAPTWDFDSFSRLESSLDSTSAILLLVMAAFLLWFPVKIRSNAAAYMTGFIVYFLARWAELRGLALWPRYQLLFSAASLAMALTCMIFWMVTMRREGESAMIVTGHRWNLLEAERLMQRLNALNERLKRLFRR